MHRGARQAAVVARLGRGLVIRRGRRRARRLRARRAVGGARQGRREGMTGDADGEDGRLRGDAGVGHHRGHVRVEHVGNEMQNPIGNQDVRLDNLRRVDKLVVALLADRQAVAPIPVAAQRLEDGAVGEVRRGDDFIRDDVVGHDARERLRRVELLERAADEVHGGVVGRKDGDVVAVVDVGHEPRGVERGDEGLRLEVGHRLAQLGGRDEEVVNHLDLAALEGNVALEDGAARAHAAGQHDGVAGLLVDEHVLALGDVGVVGGRQERGLEVRRASLELADGDGALEDVVLEKVGRLGLVLRVPDAV